MRGLTREWMWRHSTAVGITALAVLLRLSLDPVLGERSPFLLFTIPVLATALSAGSGPALLVAVLCAMAGAYFFVPPNATLRLETLASCFEVVLFCVTSALIISLVRRHAAMRAGRDRAMEELRASNAFQEAVLRGALDGVATTTEEGWILNGNPAFCRMFGLEAEHVTRHRLSDFLILPGSALAPVESMADIPVDRLGLDLNAHIGIEAIRSNQSRFPAELSITETQHQDQRRLTWFIRDVTERNAFEDALRQTTRQLAVVLENASEAIFLLDSGGGCLYMNPAAERLTGYTLAEVEGRSLHGLIHHTRPDGTPYPEAECAMACACRGSGKAAGQDTILNRSGNFIPVSYVASTVRDPADALVGAVIEIRDISQERRREAELSHSRQQLLRQQQALETLHRLGMTIAAELNLDRLVQTVVDAGVVLSKAQIGAFFYNAADAQGGHYLLYALSGAERSAFERFGMPRATSLFGPTFRGEGVIRSADILQDPRYGRNAPHAGMPEGHIPVRSYLAVPVTSRDGSIIGALFFGHADPDVFDEAAERAMVGLAAQTAVCIDNARLFDAVEAAKRTLEERVAERTQALEEINAELDAFSYTVSHDLRAPLRAVQTLASILLSEYGAALGETGRQYAERVVGAAQRMDGLVQGLLQYSRLARTDISLQPINLGFVLESVRQTLERNDEVGDAVISIPARLQKICANPGILQQVIYNLVTNAIKYRDAIRSPHISFRSEDVSGSMVRLWVEDNGIGIAREQLDKIFDVFYRAPAVASRPGTGVGLAVVKKGVERMNGRCGVESREGVGSRFWIELPAAP